MVRSKKRNLGFTLVEVLLTILLTSILLSILLPFLVQLKERANIWNANIQLEQEAIRFYTYLQNRNAGIVGWNIQSGSNSVVITVCDIYGNRIQRKIYQNGKVIAETEIISGGYLVLSQMVETIHFQSNGSMLQIELNLSYEGITRTFQGYLSKGLDL